MKKSTKIITLILSFVTITLIGLSSCKKNDASSSGNQQFLGKWLLISGSTKEYQNNVLIKSEDHIPKFNLYMTLRANGTCTIESNDPNCTSCGDVNYTISDNKFNFIGPKVKTSDGPWDITAVTDTQFAFGLTSISGTSKVVERSLFNKVK